MVKWAIFVSGNGSNLQNVLELERDILKTQEVSLVVADRDCFALQRATHFGKMHLVIPAKRDDEMLQTLRNQQVNSIFLLGYMRVLSEYFINTWKAPIINLHPSLLPKYRGLHAIQRSYDAKDNEAGVTLHEVVPELDAGPILKQLSFEVPKNISFDDFEVRIHSLERKIVSDYLLDLEHKR